MSSKNKQKFLSVIMTFCMILSIVPMQNLVVTYAADKVLEETTPLTSVWRDGRLGITEGGSSTVSADGKITVVGAGLRLSKANYDTKNATTQDNMYYSYVKAEGVTTVITKLSATQTATAGMAGVAIRADGESTYSPYFALYYDYGNKQFRYAYRTGASTTSTPYKAGASGAKSYTPTAFTDDVYVKITFTTTDGNTTATYYLSKDGTFSDAANGTQVISNFTPGTVGYFGTDATTLTASNISIQRDANTTTGVAAKYFYNSSIGEITPSFVGDTTDLSAKVYGDTVSINQNGTGGIGTVGASYILFPATSELYTMSVDTNISSYNTGTSAYGVFAGLFTSADTVANGQGGSTLALRGNSSVPQARGVYSKGSAAPYSYGAGGMAATAYALNTTYNLSITNKTSTMDYTISGETIATPVSSTCGWSNTRNFKTSSDGTNVTINQPLYYGICIAGVQCTYKNLKLINSDGVIIYDMNDYYEVASQPPVAGAVTSATVNSDRSSIDIEWTEATAAVGKGEYAVAYSTDGGKNYTVAGTTTAKKYSFNSNLDTNNYIFKVYGIYKDNTTEPQYSSSVSYVKPLPKVTVTPVENSGKVDLTWTASDGATSYDIYRADSYTALSSAKVISNVTTTSYTDADVVNGPYYYYVIAKNDTNTSNPSDNTVILVGGLNTGAYSNQLSSSVKIEGTLVYEDNAATITFENVNDTVLTDSNTVTGSVNKAGTIYAVCGDSVQSKTIAADEKFSFTFKLAVGRNDVDYYFVDADKNITKKSDNFVYLTKYDYLVNSAFAGTDGALTDGVPTYKTITAAIAAVPADNTESKVIFIKNGQYNERLDISTPYISLLGEDSVNTRIYKSVAVADNTAKGMTDRNCVAVQTTATGFTAENLTIENSFAYKNGTAEQADALMLNADQSILVNVRLVSFQDTLLTYNQSARQEFYKCYITGNVDFIYGTSTVLFDDCDIVGRYTSYKPDGCFMAPQTMKTSTYGYVFNNCRFTSETGVGENQFRLARTYGEASAAIFNNCYLGKVVRHADTLCYDVMNYPLSTARYYECNSYGPGAKVLIARQLISANDANYACKNLFAKDFSSLAEFNANKVMSKMYGALVPADYSAVYTIINSVKSLVKSDYVDFSAVTAAVTAIVWGLDSTQQAKVDTMVTNISNAVKALVKKSATPALDYTALNAAIAKADALTWSDFTEETYTPLGFPYKKAVALSKDTTVTDQSVLDNAAKALNDGMAALVRRVFHEDGNKDIKIYDSHKYLPGTAQFKAKAIESGTVYENAKKLAAELSKADQKELGQVAVFEFSLTDTATNAAITNLNGDVTIDIPVPAGFDTSKKISVFRVEANGSLTRLFTKVVDGSCSFSTNHFSTYIIAEESAISSVPDKNTQPGDTTVASDTTAASDTAASDTTSQSSSASTQTGDTTPIALYALIMGISACSIMYVSRRKKVRKVIK